MTVFRLVLYVVVWIWGTALILRCAVPLKFEDTPIGAGISACISLGIITAFHCRESLYPHLIVPLEFLLTCINGIIVVLSYKLW